MKKSIQTIIIMLGAIVFFSATLSASEVTIPNSFQEGTPAVAERVNANFNAVKNAIDDNFSLIPTMGLLDAVQSGSGYFDSNTLGVRDIDPDTVLRTVSFTAPADGFVMVTVTGRGCIHTNGGYIELFLKKGADYLDYLGIFTLRGAGTACGLGEEKHFSWQYLEPVTADVSYSFDVAGHKGSADEISGNVYITSVAAIFLQMTK